MIHKYSVVVCIDWNCVFTKIIKESEKKKYSN